MNGQIESSTKSQRTRAALAVKKAQLEAKGQRLGAPQATLEANARRRHLDALARVAADKARLPREGETVREYAARIGVGVATAHKRIAQARAAGRG